MTVALRFCGLGVPVLDAIYKGCWFAVFRIPIPDPVDHESKEEDPENPGGSREKKKKRPCLDHCFDLCLRHEPSF